MNPKKLFYGSVLLQLLVLVAMIAIKGSVVAHGQRVLLKVTPVDPRDWFRGEYVILNYEISSANTNVTADGVLMKDKMPIYVTLEPAAGGVWQRAAIVAKQPASGTYIAGTVEYAYAGWSRLKFGIESYFVAEGKGKVLEEHRNARRLQAEVALGAGGHPVLTGLRVVHDEDGEQAGFTGF